MNKTILMGRLTADPSIRFTAGNENLVANFTLAVDRRVAKDAEQTADFISCQAWNKKAEFAQKYMHKGGKFVITGRIQTGSYTKEDGTKVYTTNVVCEDIEFAESKGSSATEEAPTVTGEEGFMNIPEGIEDDLPFALPEERGAKKGKK